MMNRNIRIAVLLASLSVGHGALAQEFVALNLTGTDLQCQFTGHALSGVVRTLYSGDIELPTQFSAPPDLWPSGPNFHSSPRFIALDLDCTLPMLSTTEHRFTSLARISPFWELDLTGNTYLPNSRKAVMLTFSLGAGVDPVTHACTFPLRVDGELTWPWNPGDDWTTKNWMAYRDPEYLLTTPSQGARPRNALRLPPE